MEDYKRYSDEFIEGNFAYMKEALPEKQKEIARRGGIASGEARRIKAARKERMKQIVEDTFTSNFLLDEEIEMYKKFKAHRKYLERKRAKKEANKNKLMA